VREQVGGLPEVIDALRWRWKLALLIAVPILAGAALYAERLPPEYEGRSIVAVEPKSSTASPDLVRILAPKFVAYISAPATVERLAPGLGEDPTQLEHALNASLATDTGNITITVKLSSNAKAAAVANAFAQEVLKYADQDLLLTANLVALSPVPTQPSGPPRRMLEAAALLAGLVAGIGLAMVVERGRPRIRGWRDVARLTGYPVIGRLPPTRSLKAHRSPGAALADPAVGSGVRSLRTNLERTMGTDRRGVLVVTSSLPGEGKTTVAALLATSLARVDSRVLLIDGDLRRPGLPKDLLGPAPAGVSAVLRGRVAFPNALRTGWTDGLTLLPTTADPDAGDLLARRFSDILRQARDLFDCVIVDSPPLLGTDDARTLATLGDGVILVVSAGTMAETLAESVVALHGLKVEVVGAVTNRLRESAGATSYYSTVPVG
jgi:capsular exopolysaccharide synthesis family protein